MAITINKIYPSYTGGNMVEDQQIRELIYQTHTLLPRELMAAAEAGDLEESPRFSPVMRLSPDEAAKAVDLLVASEAFLSFGMMRSKQFHLCGKILFTVRSYREWRDEERTVCIHAKAIHPANPLWSRKNPVSVEEFFATLPSLVS